MVDVDHDDVLAKRVIIDHLLYSDYCSTEMYCLNRRTLEKFFVLACNLEIASVAGFLDLAERVLPVQFCLRALNEKLDINASVPSLQAGLTDRRDVITFEGGRYFRTFVHQNRLHIRAAELEREFSDLFGRLDVDLRNKSHGHDLVTLLFEYSARLGGFKFQNRAKDTVQYGGRLLSSSLETTSAFSERLFVELERAVTGDWTLWPRVA